MSTEQVHSAKRKGKRVKQQDRLPQIDQRKAIYNLDLLQEKFISIRIAEGLANSTMNKYRITFRNFNRYFEVQGLTKDVRNVDVNFARDYVGWLLKDYIKFEGHQFKPDRVKTKGISNRTAHDYLKQIRTFFKFLVEDEIIRSNPFDKVNNVKYTDKEISILTPEELKALLSAPDKRTYTGFRDFVIMTLLIDSMMRINEALSLKSSDIDFATGTVTVRAEIAKSRKARIIPIQKHTSNLLKELLTEVEEFENEYVFLSNYGERLEPNHFRNQLKRNYIKQAGIKKRVHPHLFRHTGATMFLEAGGDIRHLQMILGHSDLRMVMRYTHLSNRSLQEQHSKYSPLNSVIGKLNKDRKKLR
jgi:integrase/recombinase XerD